MARATLLRWTGLAMTLSRTKRWRRESVKGLARRRGKVSSRCRISVDRVAAAIDGPPFAWGSATPSERRLFFGRCQDPDTGGTPPPCPLQSAVPRRQGDVVPTAFFRRQLMASRRSHVPASFCLTCLVLCAIPGGFARADDPPPDPAEVARLIRQLGDDSFSKREQASRRLA